MSTIMNLLCCRELKRRIEKREKEAKKAQKAAASGQSAPAKAKAKDGIAAEEELNPNVRNSYITFYFRLSQPFYSKSCSNTLKLDPGRSKSFVKPKIPIHTLTSSTSPYHYLTTLKNMVRRVALQQVPGWVIRWKALLGVSTTYDPRERICGSMTCIPKARKSKSWRATSEFYNKDGRGLI